MNFNTIKDNIYEIETPSYIFDLDMLKARVMRIKEILNGTAKLCYAMKANPFIIRPMNDYIDRFEVCSPGEYEICKRHGIPADKIIVSGVNKTYESMVRIIDYSKGKGIYTIESETHYKILSKICVEKGVRLDVIIRLTSGNQFGVDSDMFVKLAELVSSDGNLMLKGIHFYSGTQKKMKKIAGELEMLAELRDNLLHNNGIELEELEYGPGLIFDYFTDEQCHDLESQLSELKSLMHDINNYPFVTFEMGRFIASECGYYCTKVVDIKRNRDYNYCIVDGGIHQINYFGQTMGMKKVHMDVISTSKELTKWNICGSLCTVNDVILRDVELPALSTGDYLIFKNCGAYSVTEGISLFLSRELPKVMFYSESGGIITVRKNMGTDSFNEESI